MADFLSLIDQSWPGGVRAVSSASSAVLGALAAALFHRISHRGLCVLISFAAGALLAVALLDLFPESAQTAGLWTAAAAAASGYGFFFVLSRFVSHVCPACSATHAEIHFGALTGPLVAALSVHSFVDGLALYGHADHTGSAMIFLAVICHKFPEGMALSLVARGAGRSRWQAFALAAFIEVVTTFLGAWAGAGFLSQANPVFSGALTGFVAGSFVFLVFHALLSELFKHHPRSTILSAGAGAAMIVALGLLGGH